MLDLAGFIPAATAEFIDKHLPCATAKMSDRSRYPGELRSAAELRQRWLDELPGMMTHPGMWARDGQEIGTVAAMRLRDLCFVDGRDQEYNDTIDALRRFGKLGVYGPFAALFRRERRCTAEVLPSRSSALARGHQVERGGGVDHVHHHGIVCRGVDLGMEAPLQLERRPGRGSLFAAGVQEPDRPCMQLRQSVLLFVGADSTASRAVTRCCWRAVLRTVIMRLFAPLLALMTVAILGSGVELWLFGDPPASHRCAHTTSPPMCGSFASRCTWSSTCVGRWPWSRPTGGHQLRGAVTHRSLVVASLLPCETLALALLAVPTPFVLPGRIG